MRSANNDTRTIQNAIAQLQQSTNEALRKAYELNNAQQREIEELKRTVLVLLPQVKNLEKRLTSDFPRFIEKWLNEHQDEIFQLILDNIQELLQQLLENYYTKNEINQILNDYVLKANVVRPTTEQELRPIIENGDYDDGNVQLFGARTVARLLAFKLNQSAVKAQYDDALLNVYSTHYINNLLKGTKETTDPSLHGYTAEYINNLISNAKVTGEDAKDKVYSADYINNNTVTPTVLDDKLKDYVLLQQIITPSGSATQTTTIYSSSQTDNLFIKNAAISDTYDSTATIGAQTLYSRYYINNLISGTKLTGDAAKTHTYTAEYLNNIIPLEGDYIKTSGVSLIDGVVLKPKSAESDFSFQIYPHGTLYAANIQGWKQGDTL